MNGRFVVHNISQLVTNEGAGWEPLRGAAQSRLRVVKGAAIVIDNGRISSVIDEESVGRYEGEKIDARQRVVMPGFVDPHTHVVFAGTREEEFYMKLKGKTYLELLQSGNGINRTVRETRAASEEEIYRQSLQRVQDAVRCGTTTLEIKTGYGLDLESEMKMLRVMDRIASLGIVNVVKTFLGMHAVPPGMTEDSYTAEVMGRMLERFSERVDFVDAFCDRGAFSPQSTDLFFAASSRKGLKMRLHADEIEDIGCLDLCLKYRLHSVDHLLETGDAGLKKILQGGSVATLLPITGFSLDRIRFPDARKFIDAGIPVAIGTDCSPVSYNISMPFAIYLAVRFCGMTVEEAINAATVNAAYSLDVLGRKATIEPGKDADILILNVDDYRKIPYQYSSSLVDSVFVMGEPIMRHGYFSL